MIYPRKAFLTCNEDLGCHYPRRRWRWRWRQQIFRIRRLYQINNLPENPGILIMTRRCLGFVEKPYSWKCLNDLWYCHMIFLVIQSTWVVNWVLSLSLSLSLCVCVCVCVKVAKELPLQNRLIFIMQYNLGWMIDLVTISPVLCFGLLVGLLGS